MENNPINAVETALAAAKAAARQREFKQKRIYISLPISGNPNHRYQAQQAANELAIKRYIPVNPIILADEYRKQHPNATETDFLKHDLDVLETCDGIFLQKGWEQSRGCLVELSFAEFIKAKMRPDFIIKGINSVIQKFEL